MSRVAKPAVLLRAVLLVDRPEVLRALEATGVLEPAGIRVVCIDGTPRARVAELKRAFGAGQRAAALYLHDAATVVYPFALEPIATLVAKRRPNEPLVYVDLGLPPVGAVPRRFADPTLPPDDLLFALDKLPAATLARYCVEGLERALLQQS